MTKTILESENIKKSYHVGTQDVTVLYGVSLLVNKGDFTVIFGPSGCGKSTLLHVLLGLESPTFGSVKLADQDLYKHLSDDDRAVLRKKMIGMVYQQPNWIKSLNVLDNVAFPLLLNGVNQEIARNIALQKLREVAMHDWALYRPTELSSGQQQKVALARGVSTDPDLIIADEPTGNLDYKSGVELMELLSGLCHEGKTIVMVTHDLDYLSYASTAIEMFDGKIIKTYSKSDIPQLLRGANRLKTAKWNGSIS